MDTEAVLGHHYLARAVDDELHRRLRIAGAVVVEGPQAAWELVELPQVIDRLARSGFPALRDLDGGDSILAMAGYLEDVTRTDIHRLAPVRHAPEVLDHLIRSLARQTAAQVRVSTLAADLEQLAPGIRAETVTSYLELLERLFVVERVPAWTPSLRSRARLRTTSRLHLADPALAASALGASPTTLLADVRTTGFLFESAVVHDLQVYVSGLGGRVHHYRDSSGREIDAVLTLPDGRWAAVEVKLGGQQASAGASSLARAVDQVDTEVHGEPVLRLVVTGTGPVLTMDDGTVTCPLSALRP
ncbi:ATP-binding protein [Actinomyces wuliandei]|uniref:ATP-binding protein n=1 Tax=Actinomyces wuliandei TaxID=2057743 RepID=UPI001118C348|nr:DUF4143 domain-containing protein [Actinomyces wuliandei]